MEIGVLIDLDSIRNFEVPSVKIPDKFSIAVLSKDKKKAEDVVSEFNSSKVIAVDYTDRDYIMEIVEDCVHVDRVFLVSHSIQSAYSIHSMEMLL